MQKNIYRRQYDEKIFHLLIVICVTATFNLSGVVFAESSKPDVDKVLQNYGYDSNIISAMSNDSKEAIADVVINDSKSVQAIQSYMTVNNLEIFEYYTNTDDTELLNNNLTTDQVKKIRSKLKELNALTEQEFINKFSSSAAEYKLVKKALTRDANYKKSKTGDRTVTTSGTISTSKMTYAMTCVNKSTATAPSYDITITYNWITTYFNDIFSDYIATAWGGGFNTKNISSQAVYQRCPWGYWEDISYTKSWNTNESPNTGIKFDTLQSSGLASTYCQNSKGNVNFTLYQTRFQGYDTKVLSQYCHSVLSIGGGSIALSSTPVSINVGTGFDTSAQLSATIRY